MAQPDSTMPGDPNRGGLIRSIVLNAAIPLALYFLAKRFVTDSEFVALAIAAIFPLVGSLVGILRARRLDLFGVLALLGIGISMIGIALGGDPKILLIRESFLTAGLGIACFASFIVMPRPLMFYFGRQFSAAGDPAKTAAFDALWEIPGARRVFNRMTLVWGAMYTGEFLLRVVMVSILPIPVVLAASPVIFGGITIATIAWTIAYARRSQREGEERAAATRRAVPPRESGGD